MLTVELLRQGYFIVSTKGLSDFICYEAQIVYFTNPEASLMNILKTSPVVTEVIQNVPIRLRGVEVALLILLLTRLVELDAESIVGRDEVLTLDRLVILLFKIISQEASFDII